LLTAGEVEALPPSLGVDGPAGDAEEAGGFGAVQPGLQVEGIGVTLFRAGVVAVQ
jgi:hypothetical protein